MKQKLLSILPYLLITFVILITFGKAAKFDFTWFDDDLQVDKLYSFNRNLRNIKEAFFQDAALSNGKYSNYYRPIFNISYIIDAQFCGKNPGCFHISQIVSHIIVSLLLFTLFRYFKVGILLSLIIALDFSLHPSIANNIGLITGRTEVILAVFLLASLLTFAKWIDSKNNLYLLLHLVLFNLAIYSKETGLLLVPILLSYLFIYKREKYDRKINNLVFIPWLISLAIWLYLRNNAVKNYQGSFFDNFSPTNLMGLLVYASRLIPYKLSVFPTVRDTNMLVAGLSILILLLIFVISGRKNKLATVGYIWLMLFALGSNFVPESKAVPVFYEQRFYITRLAIVFILAFVVNDLKKQKKLIAALGILIVIIFSYLTYKRLEFYRNPYSFWNRAVLTSPHSAEAHAGLGYAEYYYNHNKENAIADYEKALKLDPVVPFAHSNLGVIYLDEGNYKSAEREILEELKYRDLDSAWLQLGRVYYSQKNPLKALVSWQKAYAISPDWLPVNINLALVYADLGRYEDAKFYYRRALTLGEPEETDQKYLDYLKYLEEK